MLARRMPGIVKTPQPKVAALIKLIVIGASVIEASIPTIARAALGELQNLTENLHKRPPILFYARHMACHAYAYRIASQSTWLLGLACHNKVLRLKFNRRAEAERLS
jgi:hypothetical protein